MDARLFSTFGKIAGIGGLSFGVFLYVAAGFLQTKSREELQLGTHDAYMLYLVLIVMAFGIAALGFIGWIFTAIGSDPRVNPNVLIGAFALVFIAVMAASVSLPIILSPRPTTPTTPPPIAPTQPQPPQVIMRQISRILCIGQYPNGHPESKCPAASVQQGCGTDPTAWARQLCPNPTVTKLGDVGGNRCGYFTAQIDCLVPAN